MTSRQVERRERKSVDSNEPAVNKSPRNFGRQATVSSTIRNSDAYFESLTTQASGMSQAPPRYVLLSHSSLPVSSSTVATPETLVHPTIQYCYADDPLPSIGPSTEPAVLVMDFDPASTEPPRVRSLSKNVAISAVRVLDANGAAGDGEVVNPHMFVIDTLAVSDDKYGLPLVSISVASTCV